MMKVLSRYDYVGTAAVGNFCLYVRRPSWRRCATERIQISCTSSLAWRRAADAQLRSQYVFLSQAGDEIIIRLPPGSDYVKSGKPGIVRYDLHNRLRPLISAQMATLPSGRYVFDYALANGALIVNGASQDRIHSWWVVIPSNGGDPRVISPGGWGGSPSFTPDVFRNVELPDQPKGRVVGWVKLGAGENIAAGESQAGFRLESDCKPGFTTALARSEEWVSFDQELPEEVFAQLNFFDAAWPDVPALTFGPMFCSGESRRQMIQNMISGVKRAIQTGRLSSQSEFGREALAELIALGSDDSPAPVLVHAPSGEFEREISRALQLSLSFRIPPLSGGK